MRPSPAIIVLAGALLLEWCSSESAFMPVTGSDHGITLVRTRNYPWSDGWELDLVTTRMPECQRRHHLKPAGEGAFKVEVYDSGTGAYILRQGKRWYVTETKGCQLQQFKEAPPEPGTLLGAFRVKGGELRFIGAEAREKGGDEEGGGKGG
jgi:hypothetical protein